MTKPVVLTQNFDPIGQFKAGISSGPPWQSIVDFATHKSFCGKRLYPRQMTLLKLIYLETETMTDYDREVISGWAETFKDFHRPVGVQPDIWDRIDYLKANGFTHFPHVQMVMGRRASKGIMGGIVGAERIAWLYSLGSWQQHFNQVPGQVAEVMVVANSLSQAVTRQFRDIRNTVLNCEYLRPHIVSDKQTEFYIRTPGDEQTIAENKIAGITTEREIATIYCKASSSVSTSGRGGTAIAIFYDEMAHMLAGTGSTKTGEEIYCLDPATRILCSDLVWRPIGELDDGQKVVGYDECADKPGVGGRRRLREATIKHVWRNRSEAVRLNFLDGTSVVCSPNHHWLRVNSVKGGGHNAPRWAAVRAHPRPGVRQARALRPGDHIKFLVEPWDVDDTRDGGWLAGLYDGEGHITANDVSRRVTLTQNEGAVLDKARRILKDFGFEFYDHSKSGRDCRVLEIGRLEQCLRLLGQIRPERLLVKQKGLWEGRTISNAQSVKTIESIEWLPEQELVDIETTTGTFIAEGLISHNTSFQPSLDQFGPAAMTYLASSPFSKIGQFYDLYQQGRVTMDEYNRREGKLKTSSFIEEAAAQDIDVDPDEVTAAVAEPTFLVVQLPSWETYRDWERSREIPIRPGRTRTFPRWNSPVQYEPKPDGTPDERVQYRRMQRNPDKFKVERGAQFATVQDAYLNEVMVDRMFAPPGWRPPLEAQHQGRLAIAYRAHADPSRTNANFGFAIGHLEDAPPDEHGIVWPHVIIDVLKVWKPEDFPDHTIDYVRVGEELDDYLVRFPSITKMTYDQFNCQSGDTLISTGYGLLRMDEIVGALPDRTGVALELPVRSKDSDAVAEQGYHKGVVPTRKITTKLGTTLNVTPEHRLWTRKGRDKPWQKDGEWGYAEASEITVGDWLCVKRNTCMVDAEFDLTTVPGWAESWGVQRHAKEWTPTCDENLAEALGLLVAEGDYQSGEGAGRDHVRFGNSDDEVLERYRMLMEKSFGGTWRSQTTDEWKGKYHYGWVRKAGVVPGFLGRLGLTGTATDKVIPWVIYRSPAPVIRSFLRGYFEGDGGVVFGREGEAWVSACSTSEEVAKGIQQLLLSVGVFCTLWSGNYRHKGETRPQWRVLMYGQDALDFARLIGFSSTRKRQELADAVAMIEAKQTGNIRSKNQRHGDEYWVRITGIEESQADCYEISVPGPESYLANGMVSHNSAGFIAHQKRAFPNIRVLEKTFTVKENQDRFEKFKSALNLGWVHVYRDDFAEEGQSLLELELKFLQEKNGKVDRQEIGPVQTKDLADAVMVVTTELLHESLDRWWTAINRTSVGSTNVDGLRAGREQERLLYHETAQGQYTDPLQRYLAEEASKSERRAIRAERNKAALERSKIDRARRNSMGYRVPYTGDRTRGQR